MGGARQDPDPIGLWHQVGVLIQDKSVPPAKELNSTLFAIQRTQAHTDFCSVLLCLSTETQQHQKVTCIFGN